MWCEKVPPPVAHLPSALNEPVPSMVTTSPLDAIACSPTGKPSDWRNASPTCHSYAAFEVWPSAMAGVIALTSSNNPATSPRCLFDMVQPPVHDANVSVAPDHAAMAAWVA